MVSSSWVHPIYYYIYLSIIVNNWDSEVHRHTYSTVIIAWSTGTYFRTNMQKEFVSKEAELFLHVCTEVRTSTE